jgi:hypothetical protein
MMSAATAAGPLTTAIIPPGADDVSVRAAVALNARGAATTAILAEYIAMREMFAGAIGSSGASYTAVEGINAATMLAGGA